MASLFLHTKTDNDISFEGKILGLESRSLLPIIKPDWVGGFLFSWRGPIDYNMARRDRCCKSFVSFVYGVLYKLQGSSYLYIMDVYHETMCYKAFNSSSRTFIIILCFHIAFEQNFACIIFSWCKTIILLIFIRRVIS